ncbi:ABC-2 family transporter protein [Levilactobacillus cerevisiae]|uniref:ABC-2 family transporter protein n=1 Tax=Levilactobacillus cerevisiae TaxID=1704076 RepID=UPI000F7B5240|nr:ABC-2 family transporter protein [Levilactobacillus cerevisiae]
MKYWQTYQNAVTTTFAYRGNLVLHLLTVGLNILMACFMWLAVYRFSGSDNIAGIGANQMIVYLIVVNVLALIFSANPIFTLSSLIRSGNLSVMLLRPINYFRQSFWTYLGQATPYLVVYGLAIGLVSPIFHQGWVYVLGSLLLLGVTYGMYFLLISLISLTSFWLIQVWPLRPVLSALFLLLGGQAFPLQILPHAWQWLTLNPFALAGNQLTLLLLGKLSQSQLWLATGTAVGWLLLAAVLLKIVWRRGIRSFEGVGG